MKKNANVMEEISRMWTSLCMFNVFTAGFLDMEHRKLAEAIEAAGLMRHENKRAVRTISEQCGQFLNRTHGQRMEMESVKAVAGFYIPRYTREQGRQVMEELASKGYQNVNSEWTMFQATVNNFLHRIMKDDSEEMKDVARRIIQVNGLANITLAANVIFTNECKKMTGRTGMPVNNAEIQAMRAIIKATDMLSVKLLGYVDNDPKIFEPCQKSLQRLSEVLFDKNETQCNKTFSANEVKYLLQYAIWAVDEYRKEGQLPKGVKDEVFGVMGGRWLLLLKEWKAMSREEWPEGTDNEDKVDELTVRVAAQDKRARWTKEFIDNIKLKIRENANVRKNHQTGRNETRSERENGKSVGETTGAAEAVSSEPRRKLHGNQRKHGGRLFGQCYLEQPSMDGGNAVPRPPILQHG